MTEQSRVTLVRTDDGRKHTVFGRRDRKEVTLPAYDVYLDGVPIGSVARAKVTREQRTPGRRYVNARWQGVAWRISGIDALSRSREVYSRTDGIRSLIEQYGGVPWSAARDLARTATESKEPA